MKVLLLGEMPDQVVELLRMLGRLGPGEFEITVFPEDIGIQGKRAEVVLLDDIMDRAAAYDEKAFKTYADYVIKTRHDLPKPSLKCLDRRNVPQSKGDRHRNKRHRWS